MKIVSGATKHLVIILAILSMKKIMFNDRFGLTQAVLDGRKTQTRRGIKYGINVNSCNDALELSPYKVGEVVAVAQSYREAGVEVVGAEGYGQDMYAPIYVDSTAGWNNKMFVKAELMPHHIKITNVRIEELQDITESDCLAEGIEKWYYGVIATYYYHLPNQDHLEVEDLHLTPQDAYATLIDKISGKGTWERNPFVWVYEFELID